MEFQLPMTASILTYNECGKFIAHALEFDIVAVMGSREKAVQKLRTILKDHIEYGLKKGWQTMILSPAPKEYWDLAAQGDPNSPPQQLEPIVVEIPTQEDAMIHSGQLLGVIWSAYGHQLSVQ